MVDIHSHILPGLDDGAHNLEESVRMAEIAADDGIRTIIATPHHANGRFANPSGTVLSAVDLLNRELTDKRIPVKVRCGQEIRVHSDLLRELEHNALLTLNQTRYILLELPFDRIPSSLPELLHELRVLRLIPVIAHPERNGEIAAEPDKLLQLIERGALSQITSHSVNGLFGRKIQRLCFDMCRRNLVHFVASDAHDSARRPFRLSEAYDLLRQTVGDGAVDYYRTNAESLAADREIPVWEPRGVKKRWFVLWK